MVQVHAEPDDDGISMAFEQYARQLRAAGHQVVGPFDLDPCIRRKCGGHLVQRDGGDQRQRRRGRIAPANADERARVEISGRRLPCPALPPAPAGLDDRAQPDTLGRAFAGKRGDIVIGGTGLRDGIDQNRDPAAL
jgi:hypothetical protein